MQCLILAGGLATRMRPVTESIPKSLIPVLGHPFIDLQLKWLKQNGVDSVVLSIGYKGEQIRSHVGDGSAWGVKVTYVDESNDLRGTGGALRLALDSGALEERFFVVYGDSYLPLELPPVWQAFLDSRKAALMTVFKNAGAWEKSNVIFENGALKLYDKGASQDDPRFQYVDYGLSLFSSDTISRYIPPNVVMDLAAVMSRLSLEGQLAGYEVFERFYEIGSPTGLADLERHCVSENWGRNRLDSL
jgi:NDP-sugar pyrophosphorylase family protein